MRRAIRHAIGLDIGRVLSRSLVIWFPNFVPFTLLALLIASPLLVYVTVTPLDTGIQAWGLAIAVNIGSAAVSLVMAGAVAYGVFRQLRGEKASIAECFRVGLSRLLGVIGVALTVGGAIGLLGVLVAFLAARFGMGFLLLLIPVVAITSVFWVAIACAVVERTGVAASLRRSALLTKGARLPIFGIIFLIGLLQFGLGTLTEFLVPNRYEPPVTMFDPHPDDSPVQAKARFDRQWAEYEAALREAYLRSWRLGAVMTMIVSAITGGLSAVASVVVYYDLRVQKEQVDIDQIAGVFG
jgi:hypothetical protein